MERLNIDYLFDDIIIDIVGAAPFHFYRCLLSEALRLARICRQLANSHKKSYPTACCHYTSSIARNQFGLDTLSGSEIAS